MRMEMFIHGVMLLMDNAYERNAMTGFRCAADHLAEQAAETTEDIVFA